MISQQETHVPIYPFFIHPGDDPYSALEWELRDAVISAVSGEEVFRQDGVEFPAFWSQTATNIVASKYFRQVRGVRESSVAAMVERVASTIAERGEKDGYFNAEGRELFHGELASILLGQFASFNSPVWFNVGVPGSSNQSSACFLLAVDDSMESITQWYRDESVIFKGGSGAGVNVSALRAENELLSLGGRASGPLSWMKVADASAGAIKSGGVCLAPDQCIYTEKGPIPVCELASQDNGFFVLSYDPPARRFKVKRAWAWLSGQKPVYRITTDKGHFDVSYDHPVRLSTGEAIQANALTPGMSLHKCAIDYEDGYVRVHLQNGKKGKRRFHRMILEDVYGADLNGKVVHHCNEDIYDNSPDNLIVTTQDKHALLHNMKQVRRGEHVFQLYTFPKHGTDNPMHKDAPFWQDRDKVEAYKAKQGHILKNSERASEMQKDAVRQKMVNTAWKILNGGGSIQTLDAYCASRRKLLGPFEGKRWFFNAVTRNFGSYDDFVAAVGASNHRVLGVERLGVMPVYDVEVDCPTPDDKSPQSGHNFVIWPNDARVGSGIVVFNTRRAAKLICMDVDHPDILPFVWCKVHEENKARVLMAAGYSDTLDGEALASVAYQNANHSVRLSDGFLQAVESDSTWDTTWRTTGQVAKTYQARELFSQIAQAAWTAGDPGVMFSTTTNKWHTVPMSGSISTSNPCGEFVHLDNTACNLASINLLKFLRDEDGSFDTDGFCHTVDIMLLAQEILVSSSNYPTPQIACMSEHHRPLGLGFANLGALLMAKGLPYDSVQGRDLAAAVTALMTGRAYQRSAEMAQARGAFTAFEPNRDAMLGVIDQHIAALETGYESQPDVFPVWQAAGVMWDRARELGRAYGFRNSQVTLLAPTGTISFMMDCTTTGVEPDVALVNYKKLVGGGTLKHVNDQVPRALAALGYQAGAASAFGPSIAAIVRGVEAGQDLEEAGVAPGHLAVFDCAFPSVPGGRSIAWQGHVRMVAALQPFLSGAISKTINLPTDATVEDVGDAFLLAWKLGCKSIAVYRDGCKHTQVLTTTPEGEELSPAVLPTPASAPAVPKRRRLPDERQAFTHKFCVGGVHEGYLTVGLYEDGSPGEIFLKMAKEGSTLSGFADGFAVMVSVALQYGVPLHTLVEKFSYTHFEPAGWTAHAEIKYANSILDYVFRYLAGKFPSPANPVPDPTQDVSAPVAAVDTPRIDLPVNGSVGSSVCWVCGSWLLRNGSCLVCPRCGANTGCSG